jgi:hypothetical protein
LAPVTYLLAILLQPHGLLAPLLTSWQFCSSLVASWPQLLTPWQFWSNLLAFWPRLLTSWQFWSSLLAFWSR